jgi:hypothetical protein
MAKHTRKRSSKRSTSKRSHRNKKHRGGEGNVAKKNNNAVEAPAVDPVEAPAVDPVEASPAPASEGGRRKTRKVSKGASDWNKKVMMVYREMKKKDPSVKLGAAMKECSKRKKRGEL